tara:strand:- start:91 stop:435 length:345 start_codon:yes stop_codon:yes gene_type:complete
LSRWKDILAPESRVWIEYGWERSRSTRLAETDRKDCERVIQTNIATLFSSKCNINAINHIMKETKTANLDVMFSFIDYVGKGNCKPPEVLILPGLVVAHIAVSYTNTFLRNEIN